MTNRTHLVLGASGQDGLLLTDLLARQGERVVACAGPAASSGTGRPGVEWRALDITDTEAFARLVEEHSPDVVHNLAALSSSWRSTRPTWCTTSRR